jgi:hypothetical protein
MNDIRAIVQPDPENERRFATVRRVSEINLGIYRTMVQPFVKAFMTKEAAEWLKESKNTELPFEIFSDRNPMMKPVAELAEQVRENRQPAAPDNPLLKWQATVSDGIIAALDGYRDQRDSLVEKTFLAIYSSPALQALVGLGASDEPVRKRPGLDREHVALIQKRIAELKAGIAEGGPREAAIRALLYVGMAGLGADERMFNTLRQIRTENEGLTLQAFKQTVREQYFKLQLDCDGALAAIPKMLSADPAQRTRILDALHRTVRATGEVTGERAERVAQIDKLFRTGLPAARPRQATLKAIPKPRAKAARKAA